jgi:hypothetical protein
MVDETTVSPSRTANDQLNRASQVQPSGASVSVKRQYM